MKQPAYLAVNQVYIGEIPVELTRNVSGVCVCVCVLTQNTHDCRLNIVD